MVRLKLFVIVRQYQWMHLFALLICLFISFLDVTRSQSSPTFQPTQYFSTSLKSNLMAFYPFSGNAADKTGNGNDGTIYGGTTLISDRFGNPNSAYNFDGSTGYISVPGAKFNLPNQMALSFWMKPSSSQNQWAGLIDKTHFYNTAYSGGFYFLRYNTGTNQYFFSYVDPTLHPGFSETADLTLIPEAWTHIVVTKDTNVKLYVNGVMSVSRTITGSKMINNNGNRLLTFGASDNGVTGILNFYTGALDDIFIFNRTLSSSEIRDLYSFTTPTSQPTTQPSNQPSTQPSLDPSSQPSSQPTSQPSLQPFSRPSSQPTNQPTSQPSNQPTGQPTSSPTGQPSSQPTTQPSSQPTSKPTSQPTTQPSNQPTIQPSSRPSSQPSAQPTCQPSTQPTSQPISDPSSQPSSQPTTQPSRQPTCQPSGKPTGQPSSKPSSQPSSQPSAQPASFPTTQPSSQPTNQPSAQPSMQPVGVPSSQPSRQPSARPTSQPSGQPSRNPTSQPTLLPSSRPSVQPSSQPSCQPSSQPTAQPTLQPSARPTGQPSGQPSSRPSLQPTAQPSRCPIGQPSSQPTNKPSSQPASQPSSQPFGRPTSQPSCQPSRQPSRQPSSLPTTQPTSQPTSLPTSQPSCQPSRPPSGQPSRQPSRQPTAQPSSQPSLHPTTLPSTQPSLQPSARPSSKPSTQPFSQPSLSPTTQPSSKPSSQPSVPPSNQPSCRPSGRPSSQPNAQPSVQPSSRPSSQPTSQPTGQPSRQPSRRPSSEPSGCPSGQPTCRPTANPSANPSSSPSSVPTAQPLTLPSGRPSTKPSSQPSGYPSRIPTVFPSSQPSPFPSGKPTIWPSAQPSALPSVQPTGAPSSQPSSFPTFQPSSAPTGFPSTQPTVHPSSQPSAFPTCSPSNYPTGFPTTSPSSQPSDIPTSLPTCFPTSQPSNIPSSFPSSQPSSVPSSFPTTNPTLFPSSLPSACPSSIPPSYPSSSPSSLPSISPISSPTSTPTTTPTTKPSVAPTTLPTKCPQSLPSSTGYPTNTPTKRPTNQRFSIPSTVPSSLPSHFPLCHPSAQPSHDPLAQASSQPTGQPSSHPSHRPFTQPFAHPSSYPSTKPSFSPSVLSRSPSFYPSQTGPSIPSPTRAPTVVPTCSPTSMISIYPIPFFSKFQISLFLLGSPLSVPSSVLTDVRLPSFSSTPLGRSFLLLGRKDGFRSVEGLSLIQATSQDDDSLSMSVDYQDHVILLEKGDNVVGGIYPTENGQTRSVTIIGDINKDGSPDLLFGDPLNSRAFVCFGNEEGDLMFISLRVSFMITINPEPSTMKTGLGWAAAPLSDFNRDGYDDFIVTAPTVNQAYVIYGRRTKRFLNHLTLSEIQSSSQGFKIQGNSFVDRTFGMAVSEAGDVNGDGYADILISALTASSSSQANVYIIFGNRTMPLVIDLSNPAVFSQRIVKITTPKSSFSGFSIAGIGDFNGDGYDDVAIGSAPYHTGQTVSQRTFIIFGRGDFLLTKREVNVLNAEDALTIVGGGFMVTSVGDVNGDGMNDLMISSYTGWLGKSNAYCIIHPRNITLSVSMNTVTPNYRPVQYPTSLPSLLSATSSPSSFGSDLPSTTSEQQSSFPTILSSKRFNFLPTYIPSRKLSSRPSSQNPSRSPTFVPSRKPFFFPSIRPTIPRHPTSFPSSYPSNSIAVSVDEFRVTTTGEYDPPSPSTTADDDGAQVRQTNLILEVPTSGSLLIGAASNRMMYTILPSQSIISITTFRNNYDLLNLTAFPSVHSLKDLQYINVSSPLTLLLPIVSSSSSLATNIVSIQQQVILLSHQSFDLTAKSVLFVPPADHDHHTDSDSQQVTTSSTAYISALIALAILLFVLSIGFVWFAVRYFQDIKSDSKTSFVKQTSHNKDDGLDLESRGVVFLSKEFLRKPYLSDLDEKENMKLETGTNVKNDNDTFTNENDSDYENISISEDEDDSLDDNSHDDDTWNFSSSLSLAEEDKSTMTSKVDENAQPTQTTDFDSIHESKFILQDSNSSCSHFAPSHTSSLSSSFLL